MAKKSEVKDKSLLPGRWAEIMEQLFHIVLGGISLWNCHRRADLLCDPGVHHVYLFPIGMIQAINDILFIIIILEILRTVIARYTDGVFQLHNFLIIGIIAAVRHILTVGAYMTLGDEKTEAEFNRAVIELGINSAIVVALVFAIFLSKAVDSVTRKSVAAGE